MNALHLRAALAAAFALSCGPAPAAPMPAPDRNPLGALRFALSSSSPQAKALRREVAAGPAALARERAQARREGLAVFPAQLNRPLPPDDRNAAPLYLKAAALRRSRVRLPNYAETLSARFAYTPALLDRVQKIYDDNPDVFALLRSATDKPQCVFARDWTKDTFSFPSQSAGFRETARELRTEGVLEAKRGRYAEAVATEARVYRVAEHAASDPTLISYLVAEAMDAIATSGLQDVLLLAGPNADVDTQVQQALTDKAALLSLRHALSGEAAISDAGFSLLRRGGPGSLVGLFTVTLTAPRPAAAFTPQERNFYAGLLDASEAASLHNVRAVVRAADTAGASAAFARASREAQAPTDDLVQEVARRLSPFQFDILNGLPVRAEAARSVTRAAAAILAERAKTGVYPATLSGAFPDPYSPSKMLQYRREGDSGFVVYSVRPDGKGDGGEPGDAAPFSDPRFRYPPVPIPVPAADAR